LRETDPSSPRRLAQPFDLAAERAFDATIALYGRALNVVLARQPLTLFVAIATLA